MRIHLIAIGGSIMHNLALALQKQGHNVSGSDDIIYGISKDKLDKAGLLPPFGWFPERIKEDIDLIILGMHAKQDNPELIKAQSLGIPIQSFPEFIAQHAKQKKRIVVAGSHGKTSTTSMILHALTTLHISCDYLVGAQLEGFDLMVHLSEAPVMIIEGDEYLSSCLDNSPKFMHYKPSITIITGIAWDHMNVFPTKEIYENVFKEYIHSLTQSALVFYDGSDHLLHSMIQNSNIKAKEYDALEFSEGHIVWKGNLFPIHFFGEHNLKNCNAAMKVCKELGVDELDFLKALGSFKGAKMRMEVLGKINGATVYRDFAHAPSKMKATAAAIRSRYPDKKIGCIAELHTYSSLNRDFLPEYKGALDMMNKAIVCYDPEAVAIKRLKALSKDEVYSAFGKEDLTVIDNAETFETEVNTLLHEEMDVLVFFGSGNLFGFPLAERILVSDT